MTLGFSWLQKLEKKQSRRTACLLSVIVTEQQHEAGLKEGLCRGFVYMYAESSKCSYSFSVTQGARFDPELSSHLCLLLLLACTLLWILLLLKKGFYALKPDFFSLAAPVDLINQQTLVLSSLLETTKFMVQILASLKSMEMLPLLLLYRYCTSVQNFSFRTAQVLQVIHVFSAFLLSSQGAQHLSKVLCS